MVVNKIRASAWRSVKSVALASARASSWVAAAWLPNRLLATDPRFEEEDDGGGADPAAAGAGEGDRLRIPPVPREPNAEVGRALPVDVAGARGAPCGDLSDAAVAARGAPGTVLLFLLSAMMELFLALVLRSVLPFFRF
jgi:hypothetical protein